jgi:hypothetical protein
MPSCREVAERASAPIDGEPSAWDALRMRLLDRRQFRTEAEARMAVFRFIEGRCNPGRRHSALG